MPKIHSSAAKVPTAEVLSIWKEEDNKGENEQVSNKNDEPKIDSEFKIENNIPLLHQKQRQLLFPLDKMTCSDSHQDSFFVPETHSHYKTLSSTCSYYGKKDGKSFSIRTVTEKGIRGQRCWRIK